MKRISSYTVLCLSICVGITLFLAGCRQSDGSSAGGSSLQEPPAQPSQSAESKGLPRNTTEFNGYLTKGPIPAGISYQDRLYIGGENSYYLIDLDGKLIRWGANWDNRDMGWDWDEQNQTPQPFVRRNVLVEDAVKFVQGFFSSFVLDENHDLWSWDTGFALDPDNPDETPVNVPRKIMSSIQDIAVYDFDVMVVLEDGTLKHWNSGSAEEEPIVLRENAEKVYSTWGGFLCIDTNGSLYDITAVRTDEADAYPDASEKFALLDTNVKDIQDLYIGAMLVLKKDGTVGFVNRQVEPYRFTPLADHVESINRSGFVSADGDYWHVITDSGAYVDMEKEEDTAWAVYNYQGNSVRILKDGRIEVRSIEDF